MYRQGHVGASLVGYAPIGLVVAAGGTPGLALAGAAATAALSTLPDYDRRVPLVEHRGVTHTVAFALLVGAVLGAAGLVAGQAAGVAVAAWLGAFGFAVGTGSVLSHVAADALTPAGVRPFWPASSRHYSLSLVRAGNPLANYALLGLGVLVTAAWAWVAFRIV